QVDPTHEERDAVDLIFFPTGGGKTEAYLGLAAFALILRRLRNPGLQSGGVTVLMRYTLRLLTLDQLERAATLVCALEMERRKDTDRLGTHRFSIGLWVGKAATPNRFGTEKDRDDSTARSRVLAFAKDPKANPSPIPIDKCPWCGQPFSQDTFVLKPDSRTPLQLRVMCTSSRCAFKWSKDAPEGIPVLAVDDEIYRELPCFLIATVDKFAGLPWVGKTGLLLGRNATHHNALGFYGPAGKPPDAKVLPAPLLPPDLIIQDELHLIAGPLGTIVGLYETAIDHLTTRQVDGKDIRPKIVASTATVRRAHAHIRALFARSRVDIFPPPGPNRRTSFFAETVPTTQANARLYVGLAAPGRSQKVLLMRTYIALQSAAQKAFDQDPEAADAYMTLVGYFNSLRELGGSRRIVEDEVRQRLMRVAKRKRVGEEQGNLVNRTIDYECVELTSRETTDKVKIANERLRQLMTAKSKTRPPVDVALASNMISVGLDIPRLGLMVICGQPKSTAEYIQASSRVGRDDRRPGLVVTLLNAHKPRDRSHYEHFACYHASFYRGVEAGSVTPFSARAIDRGLPAVTIALARLTEPRLTAADSAANIADVKSQLGFLGDVIARRYEAHRKGHVDDDPADQVKAKLRQRVESLLDSWAHIVQNDPSGDHLAYQLYEEGQASKRPLLRMPLDPGLKQCDKHESRFVANRSMRDVEETVDVYVMNIKESAVVLEQVEGGEE
ncbi:MAG: helicase, partial [Polyangiaceae bacterium]|nr:helicase [Polyangiaceae bacterium]